MNQAAPTHNPAPATSPAPAAETPSVPQDRGERDRITACARRYAADNALAPPLCIEELQHHADAVSALVGAHDKYRDFVTVMVSNEAWRDTVAAVPCNRRVLLLPQCLRTKQTCQAEMDEFGLLCEECGRCPIGGLQAEAEELGYVTLVAEGTTVVTGLLEQGKVDAVIGVSCLPALERSFPYMAADAIPGIAVPLLRDGCDSTSVDLDRVRDAIRLRSDKTWSGWLDVDGLRAEVETWFETERLRRLLGAGATETEDIGLKWLAKSGKRWRPLLTVCVYKSLNGAAPDVPEAVREAALAVECFHKASLVHDDIEDDDSLRYGDKTLHRQHGVPIALNVGDFLLGEGYRLIAECGATPEQIARMLAAAAEGHRSLCLGQGDELCWVRKPAPLGADKVLEIFSRKTAPAFEVALRLGAIIGGTNGELCPVLKEFSEALGVGFQIRDDLQDFLAGTPDGDAAALRPSILLALACEEASGPDRERIWRLWRRGCRTAAPESELQQALQELNVENKAQALLDEYKRRAIRTLAPLQNVELKSLLYRLTRRILGA